MRQEIDAEHRATAEEMTWQRANEMLQKAFQLNRECKKSDTIMKQIYRD